MHRSHRSTQLVAALAFVIAASSIARAQGNVTIEGTVRDATARPLVGAILTIVTDTEQQVRTTVTDDSGRYRLDGLTAGRYSLSADSPGFARSVRTISAPAGATTTVDFVMAVDALTTTVTVAGQNPDSFHTVTATSALRTDVPLMDIPQAISVLPSEILEQQQIRQIGDVAKNVAGMSRATGYSDAADKFMIRGLLIDYSLKNGFKNSSVLSLSDVSNVERFEVLKGPSSLLYGRIEPGGVVNMVTKQPLFSQQQSVEFTTGRFGVARGVVDVTGPIPGFAKAAYRVIGAAEHSGSHRDLVETENLFFAPSFTWKIGDRTRLTVEGEGLRMSGTPDAGLPSDPVSFNLPVNLSIGEPRDSIRNQNWRGTYYLTHRFNDSWTLSQAGAVLRADAVRTHVNAPYGSLRADGQTFDRRVLDEPESGLSQFIRLDLIGKLHVGRQTHVLLASVEGGRERYENGLSILNIAPIDIYKPQYGAPYPARSNPPQQVRNQGADSLGLAIQDQWTLSDMWKLTLGGRADVAKTLYLDVVNSLADNSGATPVGPPLPGGTPPGGGGPPVGGGTPAPGSNEPPANPTLDATRRESSEHVGAFSPRLGIVFQPTRQVSLYVSYSKAFNPLQLIHYINLVNLQPFRARQYEGGVKLDLFNARLQTTASVFAIEQTGFPRAELGRPGSFTFDGFKKSNGLEIESTAHPGAWSVIGSYTFNTGETLVGFPGKLLLNAPRHSTSSWATWTKREGRLNGLTVGGGVYGISERVANLFDTLHLPSYVRLDGMVGLRHGRWDVQVNFKNLTSEHYFETDAIDALLLPGAPFTPELTFRIKW